MPDFVSFNEFVDRTASAKFEHHSESIALGMRFAPAAAIGSFTDASPAPAGDEMEAEFAKMKQFVLGLYTDVVNVKTQHTFLGPDGNFVDCVLLEQQPTYRAARKAGFTVSARARPAARAGARGQSDSTSFSAMVTPMLPPLRRGLVDPLGKPMACPEDRVPLRRITIAQMAQRGKFENFFRKSLPRPAGSRNAPGPEAAPPPPPFAGTFGQTEIHRHAVCQATNASTYYGCSTWLNVWQVDSSPGVFNLSQLWMLGTTNAGQIQTIESGWQTFPGLWGTDAPALFVFYNPDNYNPQTCGYVMNQNMHGFIQTNSDWVIGGAMPPPYSTVNGDQRGNQTQWEIDGQGNWWLYIGSGDADPQALGYFPVGLYANGTLAQSFWGVQFGGEVCSQPPTDPTYPHTGKMGSGLPPFPNPADSFGEVAFQKQIAVKVAAGGPMVPATLSLPPYNPLDANYKAAVGASADWGSFVFFGGPNG